MTSRKTPPPPPPPLPPGSRGRSVQHVWSPPPPSAVAQLGMNAALSGGPEADQAEWVKTEFRLKTEDGGRDTCGGDDDNSNPFGILALIVRALGVTTFCRRGATSTPTPSSNVSCVPFLPRRRPYMTRTLSQQQGRERRVRAAVGRGETEVCKKRPMTRRPSMSSTLGAHMRMRARCTGSLLLRFIFTLLISQERGRE